MTDIKTLLAVLLSKERTPEERLKSLADLHDFLQDEEVAMALAQAVHEEDTQEVRAAMLDAILSIDITRITRRAEFLDQLYQFMATERERGLRLKVVERLVPLAAADPFIELLLTETFVADMDTSIQQTCLEGLKGLPRKSPETVQLLIESVPHAPYYLRDDYLDLFDQAERADAERGYVALLSPLETFQVRTRILNKIGSFPALSETLVQGLLNYLRQEPVAKFQDHVAAILNNGTQALPELMNTVLEHLGKYPDQANLLYVFRDRLFSKPEYGAKLEELFKGATSRRLKWEILDLLFQSDRIGLFAQALQDASTWIRYAGIQYFRRNLGKQAAPIAQALMVQVPKETIVGLRREMVGLFAGMGSKESKVDDFLVSWMVKESDPGAQELMAASLPGVPLTDANRNDLLTAFVKILKEPFFTEELKSKVTERMRSFAFADSPDLKACLLALMERANDIHVLEELHTQYRKLEPDPRPFLPLMRTLFFRFIGQYPQAPLDQWLKDFEALAAENEEVRKDIPTLVKLTGATWLLKNADAADQKAALAPAVVEALRKSTAEAQRLIQEGYQSRTLRKSDLLGLFKRLLNYHDTYPLVDQLLKIMTEVKVASPELMDQCFQFLSAYPQASVAYDVQRYLENTAKEDPAFKERLKAGLSAENYQSFCVLSYEAKDASSVPRDWTDRDHWRPTYTDWPVFKLFLSMKDASAITEKLAEVPPQNVFGLQSVPYLLLMELSKKRVLDEKEMLGVGRCMGASKSNPRLEPLYDRATYLFSASWLEYVASLKGAAIPPELAAMAAEAFIEQVKRRARYVKQTPAKPPQPLTGMDLNHAKKESASAGLEWDAIWKDYAALLETASAPAPVKAAAPLDYLPYSNERRFIEFLVQTPVPEGDGTSVVTLLKLAATKKELIFKSILEKLPEPQRSRVTALLG